MQGKMRGLPRIFNNNAKRYTNETSGPVAINLRRVIGRAVDQKEDDEIMA